MEHDGMELLGRSADWTRAVFDPCLGHLACYEGSLDPETNRWTGIHVGLAKDDADAREWINGGDPPLVKVYPPPPF